MKIREAIQEGTNQLQNNQIPEAKQKIRMLLTSLLKKDKSYLITHEQENLSKIEEKQYKEGIEKLIHHVPIAYVIQTREFMGLEFGVNSNVLIPQPDTEILVEEILRQINEEDSVQILDLCTGSGCIGLSIAYYRKRANVTLTDISKEALEVAKQNASKLQVKKNTHFITSNLFQELEKQKKFDVIVSNPPYIETSIINTLDEEVRKEPTLALDGGRDGLDFYRKIAKQAPDYLKKDGTLYLEIGYNQKEAVVTLLQETKQFFSIQAKKDLAGLNRVIIAKRG